MDLSETYAQGDLGDSIEPVRAAAPAFADLRECGQWLERRLVARLRRAGLHGDVESESVLETGSGIPGDGGTTLPLRGVLTVRQACRAEDPEGVPHEGLVVPFAVEGRLRERGDGTLVLEAACLLTEDADVAYLD